MFLTEEAIPNPKGEGVTNAEVDETRANKLLAARKSVDDCIWIVFIFVPRNNLQRNVRKSSKRPTLNQETQFQRLQSAVSILRYQTIGKGRGSFPSRWVVKGWCAFLIFSASDLVTDVEW